MRKLSIMLLVLVIAHCGFYDQKPEIIKETVREVPVPGIDGIDRYIGHFTSEYSALIKIVNSDYQFAIERIPNGRLEGVSYDNLEYCVVETQVQGGILDNDDFKQFDTFNCGDWTSYSEINNTIQVDSSGGVLFNVAVRKKDNNDNPQVYNRVYIPSNTVIGTFGCTFDGEISYILNEDITCETGGFLNDTYIYGNGYVLSFLDSSNYLFSSIVSSYISNLNIASRHTPIQASANSVVEYVKFITVTEDDEMATGLMDRSFSSDYYDIHGFGNIKADERAAGVVRSSNYDEFSKISFEGTLVAKSIGGLIHWAQYISLTDSFFNGTLSSPYSQNSLVHYLKGSYVDNCYSAYINSPLFSEVPNTVVENVFYMHSGNTQYSQYNPVSYGNYLPHMNQEVFFTDFDFNNIWTMGKNYPLNY